MCAVHTAQACCRQGGGRELHACTWAMLASCKGRTPTQMHTPARSTAQLSSAQHSAHTHTHTHTHTHRPARPPARPRARADSQTHQNGAPTARKLNPNAMGDGRLGKRTREERRQGRARRARRSGCATDRVPVSTTSIGFDRCMPPENRDGPVRRPKGHNVREGCMSWA